eukprot:TRINITY_DN2335_c0_g1_i1.p1 TRINITY_DN2335_c0_g1~~TRINITY_DN2335_c0_g1_i1.p1  ORF type:complete len:214 (+),score=51.56 TRINITY_DN2335_c0_g1_i1:25-666(+)
MATPMQIEGPPAEPVLVDALPYFDEPPSAEMRLYVDRLVEEEMATFQPPDYLARLPMPELKLSQLVQGEFDRVARGERLQALDMRRYEIPAPSGAAASDVARWREATENCQAQIEHQSLRVANLELLGKFGKEAWLRANKNLDEIQAPLKRRAQQQKRSIDEVNLARKAEQTKQSAQQLRTAESRFREMCTKNLDLQLECRRMEREIKRLRRF